MRYVVYGLGISGVSAIKFFAKKNHEVIATDDNFQAIENLRTSFEKGGVIAASGNDGGFKLNHPSQNASHFDPPSFSKRVLFLKPDEIIFDEKTTIIAAPGIPLYFPKTHKIVELARKTKAKLICDIEEFYLNNQNQNFLGITGTNGKSTTTALTGFIFKELNLPSEIGGNIGLPCFELTNLADYQNKKTYIFETSSYQLDLIDRSHFRVAALLNITPDHIDHHGSMQGYIEAKKNIFKNQVVGDYAVINVDNENSKAVFDELKKNQNFKATLIPISTKKINVGGVSVINNILYNKIGEENSEHHLGNIFLKGEHNAENIAMAFALTFCHLKQEKLLEKISESQIIDAIRKFKGLRHRLQFLGAIDDIHFINDSKATNAESTENALKAYDNIFWILGGRFKEGGIAILKPYFNKIKKAYLIGEASENFAKILDENSVEFEKCGNLENAIKKSFSDAKKYSLKEKNILLSPACASLDQWKNFEERGDFFCKSFDELHNTAET
ncbi:MAG: UDP-N-acetylmuramoyl-L-alanine--D-glutamate ligase [Rickettsiales bacterium]|nr:UDP-N-acetylmuramoyl-L-alanine--D-glutamate ligase [Rickettsiales bacterium]